MISLFRKQNLSQESSPVEDQGSDNSTVADAAAKSSQPAFEDQLPPGITPAAQRRRNRFLKEYSEFIEAQHPSSAEPSASPIEKPVLAVVGKEPVTAVAQSSDAPKETHANPVT